MWHKIENYVKKAQRFRLNWDTTINKSVRWHRECAPFLANIVFLIVKAYCLKKITCLSEWPSCHRFRPRSGQWSQLITHTHTSRVAGRTVAQNRSSYRHGISLIVDVFGAAANPVVSWCWCAYECVCMWRESLASGDASSRFVERWSRSFFSLFTVILFFQLIWAHKFTIFWSFVAWSELFFTFVCVCVCDLIDSPKPKTSLFNKVNLFVPKLPTDTHTHTSKEI